MLMIKSHKHASPHQQVAFTRLKLAIYDKAGESDLENGFIRRMKDKNENVKPTLCSDYVWLIKKQYTVSDHRESLVKKRGLNAETI